MCHPRPHLLVFIRFIVNTTGRRKPGRAVTGGGTVGQPAGVAAATGRKAALTGEELSHGRCRCGPLRKPSRRDATMDGRLSTAMTEGTAHAIIRAPAALVPGPAAARLIVLLRHGQVPHAAMTRQARNQVDGAIPARRPHRLQTRLRPSTAPARSPGGVVNVVAEHHVPTGIMPAEGASPAGGRTREAGDASVAPAATADIRVRLLGRFAVLRCPQGRCPFAPVPPPCSRRAPGSRPLGLVQTADMPARVVWLPARVVWLPAHSAGCEVRRALGAGLGTVVTLGSAE
jgi:hypothetical protein